MKMRRMGSIATLLGLTGLLASSAGPAAGGQVRLDTTLGGFTVTTESAPLRVLIDDPTVPLPRPPGSAIADADVSYTKATLDTGPTARGLAASLWPGNLLGDGWSQIAGSLSQYVPGFPMTYPVKADARYPDNPHEATGGDGGTFMTASAEGLDVSATARAVPPVPAGVLSVGGATSTSTATVKDGWAIGTSVSQVSDLWFMNLIHIGSVSTTLTTKSDGLKPTSSGSTVVNGLTIAGYGYSVDDKGAHPVGVPAPGAPPLPSGVFDPAKLLGITIEPVLQSGKTVKGTQAARTASGLVIVIDTHALRAALSPVTSLLQSPLATLISKLPPDPTGQLPFSPQVLAYFATQTTPKITLMIGAGNGASDAVQPITFSFPPDNFGSLNTTPALVQGTASHFTPSVSAPSSAGVLVPNVGPPPQVATTTPGTQPAAVSRPASDPFHGIPAGLLLLAGAVAATVATGLMRLRTTALAPDGGSSLPDLRGDLP